MQEFEKFWVDLSVRTQNRQERDITEGCTPP